MRGRLCNEVQSYDWLGNPKYKSIDELRGITQASAPTSYFEKFKQT